ncbi:MAG: hypothetical protein ACI837_002501 [Crocinitomicaceae bacterium]|jgi:hypothetical protein
MSKKVNVKMNQESGELRITMNRRGFDHLMMKLDRVRAKMNSEYAISAQDQAIDLSMNDDTIKAIVFEMD